MNPTQTRPKPIAYGNGRTGDIIHPDCWGDYVDARRSYDVQGRLMAYGMLGTLYFSAKELRGHKCAHCGQEFKPTTTT